MSRAAAAAASALAGLAIAPVPATAGTARVEDGVVAFAAAPGERNAIAFDHRGRLRDDHTPIQPGPGCSATADPHAVECGPPAEFVASLGDLDDVFDANPGPEQPLTRISGGPGDDRLIGGRGTDRLSGGPGDDSISTSNAGGLNFSPIVPLAQGDQTACGSGVDALTVDYADGVGADCEFFAGGTPGWRSVRVGARPRLALKVRCAWHRSAPCRGRAALRAAVATTPTTVAAGLLAPGSRPPARCPSFLRAERLAAGTFDVRAGRVGRVVIALPARLTRRVAARGCLPVLAHFAFDGGSDSYESIRTLSLISAAR